MIKKDSNQKLASHLSNKSEIQIIPVKFFFALTALFIITLWSYWSIILLMFKDWQRSDDYSAGQLVPLIAVFLVYRERNKIKECIWKPCWLWGILLLLIAQAGRFFGLLFMFESAERYSIVLTIAGLILMVGGWQIFRRVSWIILFLFLMVPLPGKIHNLISGPLQSIATSGSVFILEIFIPKISQHGNVVMLDENTPMAVAEACSGLRMLTAFIIVAAFISYMIKRSRIQKAVLLISSIPIAVICNIIRLCITAILILLANTEIAEKFFHDFAGIVMMPGAVLLIFSELWLMKILTVTEHKPQKISIINSKKLKI